MGSKAAALREQQRRTYVARGVAFAVASGICYGLYTAFLTLAETQGVWGEWFAGATWGAGREAFSPFVVTFVLAALAAGLNDLFSGIWSLAVCAKNRQLGDVVKTLRSKPGAVMVMCAVLGGPLATIAYVVALNAATAAGNPGVIVPIAALNCAIGAVLGRVFFRQELNGHKVVGILICLVAGAVIGGTSFAALGPEALLACAFAFVAAFGWGFEGCVAGFGTVLIDYRIGICIRQLSAGLLELLVVFPLLAVVGGHAASVPDLLGAALTSPVLAIFAVSGLFAMPAFSFWYKGNSMCGAALGMACNGMYAFWAPFFIWIVMGVLGIGGMSEAYPPLAPVQWAGALAMVVGIFVIAVDPAKVLRPKEEELGEVEGCDRIRVAGQSATVPQGLPLCYAIVMSFADGMERSSREVVEDLRSSFGDHKLLEPHAVNETLMALAENGLLEEAGYTIDDAGELRIYYHISDFGTQMAQRYL